MAIENGTAPTGGARRFKLAGSSSSAARTAAIVAATLTVAVTLALMTPSAGLRGILGSASQYLTSASLGASLTSWTGTLAGNSSSSSSSITSSSAASETSTGKGPGAADAGDPDLPCRESGYCSVGKLQAYVGEVDSTEGFKKMVRLAVVRVGLRVRSGPAATSTRGACPVQLNAACYKKECFMLTIGTGGHLLGMNFGAVLWPVVCTHCSCASLTGIAHRLQRRYLATTCAIARSCRRVEAGPCQRHAARKEQRVLRQACASRLQQRHLRVV